MDGAYREFDPHPSVAATVRCEWVRSAGDGRDLVVLPDGCVDLVSASDGRLFVAGPDLRPAVHLHAAGVDFVGLRLQPGTAATVLGVSADELLNGQADLDQLWPGAGLLAERIAAAAPDRRLAVLRDAMRDRLLSRPIDRQVRGVVHELACGHMTVANACDRVDLSERQLRRRFVQQVGYAPKSFDRVMRFRRFLSSSRPVVLGERTLAWTAAAAGYFDQAHLVRDCRTLAGSTPSELVSSWWGSATDVRPGMTETSKPG